MFLCIKGLSSSLMIDYLEHSSMLREQTVLNFVLVQHPKLMEVCMYSVKNLWILINPNTLLDNSNCVIFN